MSFGTVRPRMMENGEQPAIRALSKYRRIIKFIGMTITFIIPVRHPDNIRDKDKFEKNLKAALASILAQDDPGWRAVIVANEGMALPDIPGRISVCRADFPVNPLHDPPQGRKDNEEWYAAVERNKGRRILAGMLAMPPSDYYMVVDDDDLISRRIAGFVARHKGANGFYAENGYIWKDERCWLYRHPALWQVCGSTLIVRSDLYGLPPRMEDADDHFVRKVLGCHKFIVDHLREKGAPLAPLPFPGAIYRINHANSHSSPRGIISYHLRNKPMDLVLKMARLRRLSRRVRREFMAGGHSGHRETRIAAAR